MHGENNDLLVVGSKAPIYFDEAIHVEKGEEIEADIRTALQPVSIITHLEPVEDPASWQDIPLIRE